MEVLKINLRVMHEGLFHIDNSRSLPSSPTQRLHPGRRPKRPPSNPSCSNAIWARSCSPWKISRKNACAKNSRPPPAVCNSATKSAKRPWSLLKSPDLLDRILADFAGLRGSGGGDQQTLRLSGGGLAQAGPAPGHPHPVQQRGGQDLAYGGGPGTDARRGKDQILGHDRPESVLPGRERSEAQDPGHRGGGGSRKGFPTR